MEQSIYVQAQYPKVVGLQNKIAALYGEQHTAEQLLTMGYTHSGLTNLHDHVEFCISQIKSWERMLEQQNRRNKKVVLHH
jgi:hypothetical protein